MPTVPQTSVIFFALLVGFVVFITLKGELAGYLFVIGLGGSEGAGKALNATTPGGVVITPGGAR